MSLRKMENDILYYYFRLEQLHLNKNKLKHIFYPSANHSGSAVADNDKLHGRCFVPFESLQCLLLGISGARSAPSPHDFSDEYLRTVGFMLPPICFYNHLPAQVLFS